MPDDLLRAALARSIAARLPLWSEEELRALDVVALTFEAIRHGDGRDWLRHVATGPGDIDDDFHLARRLRATVATACGGSWPIDDAVEQSPNPPLLERCEACWRAAAYSSPGGPALGEALLVVVAEMAERDQERKELREQARAEMLYRAGDERDRQLDAGEFSPDQHRTRLDSTSAVMELCEIPRTRDEELEVEIWIDDEHAELADEWGVGDVGGQA